MQTRPPPPRAWRGWLVALAVAPLALVIFALLAPHLPAAETTEAIILAAVLTFGCVSAEVLLVAAVAPPVRPRALALLVLPICVLVLVAVAGADVPRVLAAALVTAALLAFGTLAGAAVGGAIERAGYLVIVAAVSALVDVFSVLHPRGPTAQLIEIETAINVLLLPWPLIGTTRIEPVLGVGDVAFAAIYLAAGRRHALPRARTVTALALGLAVTLAVVLVTGRGVPALPFLGIAVVLAHPEARRVPKEDRRTALVGLVVLAAVFGLLFALR